MNIKRYISLVLPFILVITIALSGCSDQVNRVEKLHEAFATIEEGINSTFGEDECNFALMKEYLGVWADTCDFEIKKDDEHYMLISNPATEGFEKKPSTTFQCSIDTNNPKNSYYVLATAMSALLGPDNHGNLYLLITELTDGNHIGASAVPEKYLNSSNFINLQNSKNQTVFTEGAYMATGKITSSSKMKIPDYTEAYTITMRITDHTDPYNFEKSSNYPNPIQVIGGILASIKSSGKLYDIASFSSESLDGYSPYAASVTVVIDKNGVDNFKNKFDKSYENMQEKFGELESEFVYTMTPVDMPDKVLSDKTANNLVSLMYTLNTGVCSQDEESGSTAAVSYINSVITEKGRLEISLNMRTRSEESLDNLSLEYKTTAGLCSTKYSCSKTYRAWNSSDKTNLAEFFRNAVPLEESDSTIPIKTFDNDFFAKTNPSVNLITYSFGDNDKELALEQLLHFIDPEYVAEDSNELEKTEAE